MGRVRDRKTLVSLPPDLLRLVSSHIESYRQILALAAACRGFSAIFNESYWKRIFRRDVAASLELPDDWQRHDHGYAKECPIPKRFGRPYKEACLYARWVESKYLVEIAALEGFEVSLERILGRYGHLSDASVLEYLALGGHVALYEAYARERPDFDLLKRLHGYPSEADELRRREEGLLKILQNVEQKNVSRIPDVFLSNGWLEAAAFLLRENPQAAVSDDFLPLAVSLANEGLAKDFLASRRMSSKGLYLAFSRLSIDQAAAEPPRMLDLLWSSALGLPELERRSFLAKVLEMSVRLERDAEQTVGKLLAKRAYLALADCC